MFIKNKCKNTFLEIQGKVRWDLGSPAVWTLALETGRYLSHWSLTKLTCTLGVCFSALKEQGWVRGSAWRTEKCEAEPRPFPWSKNRNSVGLTMESLNAPGLAGREKGKQPLFLSRNKTVLSSLLKEANTVTSSEFSQGDLSWLLHLRLQLAVWHKMRFIKSVTLTQLQEEVWEEGREKLLVLVLFIFWLWYDGAKGRE